MSNVSAVESRITLLDDYKRSIVTHVRFVIKQFCIVLLITVKFCFVLLTLMSIYTKLILIIRLCKLQTEFSFLVFIPLLNKNLGFHAKVIILVHNKIISQLILEPSCFTRNHYSIHD